MLRGATLDHQAPVQEEAALDQGLPGGRCRGHEVRQVHHVKTHRVLALGPRGMMDGHRFQGAEGVDRVRQQIIIQADLAPVRALGNPHSLHGGAAAPQLAGQRELGALHLGFPHEMPVEDDGHGPPAPRDAVEVLDWYAPALLVAGPPAIHAGLRDAAVALLGNLQRFFSPSVMCSSALGC